MTQWKKINTKIIANFQIDEVELPTGKRFDYLTVNYTPAVGIIPLTFDQKIIMVGQYRYPISEYSWEIPCGSIENGESIEECARRELLEETGYEAKEIELFASFYPSNASTNQEIHLCLAQEIILKDRNPKRHELAEELLELKQTKLDDLIQEIYNNKLKDSVTIIGILLALKHIKNKI